MRVYLDSSALLKRVLAEEESGAVVEALQTHVDDGDVLAASSLAWVEVSRAIRAYATSRRAVDVDDVVEVAMSGILEQPINPQVVALARRLKPPVLHSLDAIHLASAILLDANCVMTYDQRFVEAARYHRIKVLSPAPPV